MRGGANQKNFLGKGAKMAKSLGKTAQNWKFAPSTFSFLSEDPPKKIDDEVCLESMKHLI